MIQFTDKRMYLKGTAEAIGMDRATGEILYYSNKFQTGNVTPSVTLGEIRAGLGNAVSALIPTDATLNVDFVAADFNLWAKSAQMGAALKYSAPVMACQNVTAEGTSLTISVADGAPVAQAGMSVVRCYVQEVGAASLVAKDGKPYEINPTSGAISGFTAEVGKTYKVWYFVTRANAQMATITTAMDPKIMHFTVAMAVFCNDSSAAQNEGTRCGTLYVIVPNLKLSANGGVVGDQTNNDTTSLSGQALAYDPDVVSENCNGCSGGAAELAYYIYVPCTESETDYQGIVAKIGGVVTMEKSSTMQVAPQAVMANGQLVTIPPAKCSYQVVGVDGLTVSDSGLLTSSTTAGDADLTVSLTVGEKTFTDQCTVTVKA